MISQLKQIIIEELHLLVEQIIFKSPDDPTGINLKPFVPPPTGPTEEELNYLASLGLDDELSRPGRRKFVSPQEIMNLRQIGMDPSALDIYDPKYNPGPEQYEKREQEKYIPIPSQWSHQFITKPYLQQQMEIEDWNRREAERVAKIADVNQQLLAPDTGTWEGEMRRPPPTPVWMKHLMAPPGEPEAFGLETDWHMPEYFDEEVDLAMASEPSAYEQMPETGGVFVRSSSKGGYYGTPHMKELIDGLKDVAGGGFYVGDISLEGGGDIAYHKSHEAGVDADISLPTINNGMSIQPDTRRADGWGFKNIRPSQMDYDRTVEFLRKVGPRSYAVLLDPMFFPGIKAKMDELLASGEMSAAEYRRISGVNPRHGSRQTQRSWGRVSNYWGNGLLKSQPDGAHENHFHLRLRGVYPKGDVRARGQRNRPATAHGGRDRDTGTSI